jgi:hypothetical protein
MAEQVTLRSGFTIDTRDFRAFARDLRRSEPVLAKGLKVKLRAAGQIVAEKARGIASESSKTIPPSIRVRVSGATVSVVAGGNGIPLAGLFELGNADGAGAPETFKHPIFGRWVTGKGYQPMHPFLLPALADSHAAADEAILSALDDAIQVMIGR